jgi:hypothetical protein
MATELRLIPGGEKAIRILAPLIATQSDPIKAMLPFHIELK